MKTAKLVELIENVQNFSEAWDTFSVFYESKSHDVELIKTPNGWSCHIVKITKKVEGKETIYSRTFVLKKEGKTMTEAYKDAALTFLSK